MREIETNIGTSERDTAERLGDRAPFRAGTAQEFPSRRNIVKKLTNADGGSLPARGIVRGGDRPAGSLDGEAFSKREIDAIAGSASPRKPKLDTPTRSAALRIFEVPCRTSASDASSRSIPDPSSLTRISL